MCNHPNREAAMVVIRRDHNDVPTVWCDPCIAPIVAALNVASLPTVASCCGHGQRPGRISLRDGRELFLVPDYEAATALERLTAPAVTEAVGTETAALWPYGTDAACRLIAAAGNPNERVENRDGWAVTMPGRPDVFAIEVARARERLEQAITHIESANFCHHCGKPPEIDGDHSCTCPLSDSECLEHTLNPATPAPVDETSEGEGGCLCDLAVYQPPFNPHLNCPVHRADSGTDGGGEK